MRSIITAFSSGITYTILIITIMILGVRYGISLKLLTRDFTSDFNPILYHVYLAFFPILFGIVLALPNLFNEFCKEGIWKADWVKLLAIGIPNLLLNQSIIILAFTPINKIKYFTTFNPFTEVLIMNSTVISLSGTIFGYILITSINKYTYFVE